MKRVEVRWDDDKEWYVALDGVPQAFDRDDVTGKAEVVEYARNLARQLSELPGETVELIIYTKSGRIGKGSDSRSTYPRSADPRRSKG